ncbi:homologous recombination OB-fold protein isoform X2 [Dunckerocampus dactyliophorus]|uniref:homologous recombination OB-fold protein isoform X2 n=1 Tax=Dunckerocampus dactyliophorus TaxID=161453 RepID=UPI002406C731|nr:homologous recombination OB-fold protein isoform X2 [Dunckerocampus dactyliophorus]
MPAMSCKLSGLFSIGEDFDDEDLLASEWSVRPPTTGPSLPLDASCVGTNTLQPSGARPASLRPCSASSACLETVAPSLRKLSSIAQAHPPKPSVPESLLALGSWAQQKPVVIQDDFDDWDVDLADLEECDRQVGSLAPPPPVKMLRPPTSGGTQSTSISTSSPSLAPLTPRPVPPQRPAFNSGHTASSPAPSPLPRTLSNPHQVVWATPGPSSHPAPPQSPALFPGLTASSPVPGPLPRTLHKPHQTATPGPSSHPARGLFETVSPSSSPALSPHPLSTPVLTNRLVQLVSASSKVPRKRPRFEPHQPRTRRFPGPAGLLPQQPHSQSLDEIVVSVPQTPAHGVKARLPSHVGSSQAEEEEFSGGAWTAMKAEMGLDERNPSCFLRSYSVVMAALKQLSKNKVPNMAVLLKSITHTHADAKAVFKDPTGEMQGTVHRRLVEERLGDLKVGAVLLLKRVSVFSPSHRNHYLNVTPNNLLRIYSPDGACRSSAQLPPLVLEPMALSPDVPKEHMSRMQLEFDEEEEDGGSREPHIETVQQDSGWDADDLDELLGALPADTYSL